MEIYNELIRRVAEALDASGLDYMFTGALASSFYGIARTTVDIDIVVRIAAKSQRARLVSTLKQAGLRADEKKIDEALKSGYRIATFGNTKSPYSVDVIFSVGRRLEKRAGTIVGLPTFYQTPEGLILAKLRMIRATVPRERAAKDEEDVRAILRFTKVDIELVKKRARKDGTLSIFESLQP